MSTLIARRITKSFGLTQANEAVDLELHGGEVHALLGQNGAGKSTLVGVLEGRFVPEKGQVILDGEEMPLGDPYAAAARGIATVFQELMLVPSMTGLENIALALRVSANRTTRRRVEAAQHEFDLPAKLDVPVRDLELPERQRIEIVRALCQEPSVLLLDEPTSLISPMATPAFLAKVRALAESGIAVLLITHRLDEARSIADKTTILRQGRVVASYERAQLPSNSDLAMAMLGTRLVDELRTFEPGERTVLTISDLCASDDHRHARVNEVSLALREGEIVGIAGVDGNGQLELLETIAGLRRPTSGRVEYEGQEIAGKHYEELHKQGIQFVSGDRQRHGIVPTFSIGQHFEYVLGSDVLGGLRHVLTRYEVRPAEPSFRGDQLSGGNQQKMTVACACERNPTLLLLSYPTHGLDVQASLTIRRILLDRARDHRVGVLIAESNLDELLSICHRVIVMNRGRIAGVQSRDAFDRQQLAEWFTVSEATATVGA